MILAGKKIIEEVERGNIILEPFNRTMVNPNSYNYTLNPALYEVVDNILDPRKKSTLNEIHIPESGYVLEPGRLYLGCTNEIIGSNDYMISLIGRSSVARLGLFLQITADMGHVGSCHRWTLELTTIQPLRIYPNMRIGQVSFWRVSGKIEERYLEGYSEFMHPTPSRHQRSRL